MIVNRTKNATLATQTIPCTSIFKRMKGLLGTANLAENYACYIRPCNQIHTFGMKYPIDVYFVSKKNVVVEILRDVKPNRLTKMCLKGHYVLEFSAGKHRDCEVGDTLEVNLES